MPPFADRELPADFEIKPIVKRQYRGLRPFGPDNPAPVKQKGAVAKITRDLKEGIITAAENIGSDGNGTGGLVGFLEDLGRNHKKAFASLLVKLIPMQISGDDTIGNRIGTVNVISIPHDTYLSSEDIERLRLPGRAIEHTPEPAPELTE